MRGKDDAIRKEIVDLDAKLASLDPHTQGAEYNQLLDIRAKLLEQADNGVLSKIDPNMVLRIIATFGIAGAVMLFEAYGHIFTSKATGFLPKLL